MSPIEKPGISPLILPQATRDNDLNPLELEDSIVQLHTFGGNMPRAATMGTTSSLSPHSPRVAPSISRLSQRRGSRASSWIDHNALSRFISRGSNASFLTNEKANNIPQVLKPPRINYYCSEEGATTYNNLNEISLEHFDDDISGLNGATFWLDITNPTNMELEELAIHFKLHLITLENIQSSSSIERWEHYDNYLYVSLLALSDELTVGSLMRDMRVIGTPVHLIILPRGIISIQLDSVRYQDKVIRRVNLIKSHLKIHSGWIAYAILDEVVDQLTAILKYLEEKVEGIEDEMFVLKDDSVDRSKDLDVDYQAQLKILGVVKYQVFGLSKLTYAKAEICRGLIKKFTTQNLPWEGIQLYLGDVEDHAISLNQGISHIETILRNLHTCYTTHMSLKVIQQDQQSLTSSLRLTYFGAVVSIGLTVSGTWGMRCLVPWQPPSGESWPVDWFLGIIGITLTISIILAYLANRFATRALASEDQYIAEVSKYKNQKAERMEEFQRVNTSSTLANWLPIKFNRAK